MLAPLTMVFVLTAFISQVVTLIFYIRKETDKISIAQGVTITLLWLALIVFSLRNQIP